MREKKIILAETGQTNGLWVRKAVMVVFFFLFPFSWIARTTGDFTGLSFRVSFRWVGSVSVALSYGAYVFTDRSR